jgi:hypothetical protein
VDKRGPPHRRLREYKMKTYRIALKRVKNTEKIKHKNFVLLSIFLQHY